MQVYALTTDAKEAEVNWFHEHLQELLELTPNTHTHTHTHTTKQKRYPFHHNWDWITKVGSKEIPGVTGKFSLTIIQNEVGQRLTEFDLDDTLVIANITLKGQKRQLYTWTSPTGQYENQVDYIVDEAGEAVYTVTKNNTWS